MSGRSGALALGVRGLAGIKVPVRHGLPKVILRKLPLIVEVEQMMSIRGVEWSPAFEVKCDAASRAYFGIVEADTKPGEPHPDAFGKGKSQFGDDDFASYGAALTAWYDWREVVRELDEIEDWQRVRYWSVRSVDVTDGHGAALGCLHRFERQLYVALKGLLPGARLTLDGTGRKGSQSVDDWGAALEAEARRFRASR